MAVAAIGMVVARLGHADIELPTVPPAQPEAVTVKTFVGEPVDVPLSGVSRSGGRLQFLIRRAPTAGSLSPITPTGRNTAVVTYTPDANAGPGVDRFRYAVHAPSGGVSTPAEVLINVVERPPIFNAPARLDFPSVAVGRSASESLEVRNDGGSRIDGTLSVPPPWKVVGNPRYSLGPGDSRTFVISFTPSGEQRYVELGLFSHGAEEVEIGLSGRGYAPIEVVPREVRLESAGRRAERTGGFVIRNISDEDRDLVLQLPPEVQGPARVQVAARAESKVDLQTRDGFLKPLEGEIKISGDGAAIEVPLRVLPAPADVKVSPAAIDLGTFPAGKYGRAKFKLENVGGSPASLRATVPEGAQIYPDPSYEELGPGQTREFEVSFARPGASTLDGEIALEANGQMLSVAVKARVTDSSPITPANDTRVTRIAAMLNNIPPVQQVNMTQTKSSVELSWKRTSPEAVRYALYLRTMGVGPSGKVEFKYHPLPRVVPRIVRDEVRADLHGLRPGERVTVMIVAFDKDGKTSLPSPPLEVFAKPRKPWNIPWTGLGIAGIVGFVFLIVRERRRRRGTTVSDIERIYRD